MADGPSPPSGGQSPAIQPQWLPETDASSPKTLPI